MTTGLDQTSVAAAWMSSILGADSTLQALIPGGIHEDRIRGTITYPAIVFNMQSATDVRAQGAFPLALDMTWQVKAVDNQPSYARCSNIIQRVKQLMDAQSGNARGGLVLWCEQLQMLRFQATSPEGVMESYLGVLFKIYSS